MIIVCKKYSVNHKAKGSKKNRHPAFQVRPMNCTETNEQVCFISMVSHILSLIRNANLVRGIKLWICRAHLIS